MDEARAAKLRKRGHEGRCAVYVIMEIEGSPRYLKIGISRHPTKRFAGTENPRETKLFGYVEFPSRAMARLVEVYLHARFASWRKRGEWFGAGVSSIELMADEIMLEMRRTLYEPAILAGKTVDDFIYVELPDVPVEWWLQREAA